MYANFWRSPLTELTACTIQWHPTQDEWGYFMYVAPKPEFFVADALISEGQARMTLFASSGNARTFNYQAGDVSYIPATYGTLGSSPSE